MVRFYKYWVKFQNFILIYKTLNGLSPWYMKLLIKTIALQHINYKNSQLPKPNLQIFFHAVFMHWNLEQLAKWTYKLCKNLQIFKEKCYMLFFFQKQMSVQLFNMQLHDYLIHRQFLALWCFYCLWLLFLCLLLPIYGTVYAWIKASRVNTSFVLIELPSLHKELFVINHYNFLCIIVGFAITRWQISHVFFYVKATDNLRTMYSYNM